MTNDLETKMREKAESFFQRTCEGLIGAEETVHDLTELLLDVAMEGDREIHIHPTKPFSEVPPPIQAQSTLILAKSEQTPCPHIIVGEDGTHYCSLAEANVTQQAQVNDVTIAQLRAELAKVSTALGQSAVAEASLRADLERAQGTIKRYNEAFLHRHVAHYKTVGDQDILTDTCEECGLDLRDDIHKRVQALAKKE